MRESMYLDAYLNASEAHRWTVGTFLAYQLRGTARDYTGRYQRALQRAINRRIERGEVQAVPSAKGGTAYVRTPVVTP